jgi:hypothetical protein
MKKAPCVLGVSEHAGWAYVIGVAARDGVPAVIARRRLTLIDPGLPTLPYHHEATAMTDSAADALITRVRQSIAEQTTASLQRLVTELAPHHAAVALAIRQPPFDDLPGTYAPVRDSYRLMCAADGMMYQLAICRASRQLGLDVQMSPRGEETARAAKQLGTTPGAIQKFVNRSGRPPGPPWTEEHRRAYAASIAVLATHVRGRLRIP